MTVKVLFNPINREVETETGEVLLDVMRNAGIRIESLCGGQGICGKCKVILERGDVDKFSNFHENMLSQRELDGGYLLACKVRLLGDSVFTIPVESRIDQPSILISAELTIDNPDPAVGKYLVELESPGKTSSLFPRRRINLKGYTGLQPRVGDDRLDELDEISDGTVMATVSRSNNLPEIIKLEQGDTRDSNYGLALDIGTTTIAGVLVDLNTGEVVSRASGMNRQITFGEELVTRISFARDPEGLKKLQGIVVESINGVISEVTEEAVVSPDDVTDVCVGGNTVMNHLFAGLDPSYLEIADVEVSREPIVRRAGELGVKVYPGAYVYNVPNVSRFLGGDAVGDVLASGMHKSQEVSLMVDLGTNGEVVFGNSEWLFSSSCASGPAFEGEGVRHGMRGARGGIDHVKIDPVTFRVEVSVIGGVKPKGICGSGLIDLVAEMFRVGVLDFTGKLVPGRTPLVRDGKWGLEYVVVPVAETSTGHDIVFTQADLDYVIDSKAAACGAITVLMKKLKIGIDDVRKLYLAGAFGNYSDVGNSTRLGIFPEFPNAEVHPIGNGSLSGAYAALMSMDARREAKEIAKKMVYVDLLVDVDFTEEYSKALYLPGAKEYFPNLG
ncbi:MAG TPA: ASKHA domain-containing protein [Patescibacteria group bacterium]|nr:ASKHA domain-containing protein [Patescibacteria group bacterium]